MKATQNFKTTVKEVTNSYKLRGEVTRKIHSLKIEEKWNEKIELEARLQEWDKLYFDQLPTVIVSFMIGHRLYYRNVVKIGKSYFTNGDKMTKGRGYYCIKEIEEITEKMQNDMIADMYYY